MEGITMTLTLQHEEVQQYFDMKDDLAHYKARCQELEETVENYRIHFNTLDTCYPSEAEVEDMAEQFTTTEHATGFHRPKDLEPANAMKTWSAEEYDTIRYLFRKKMYDKTPFEPLVASLFPHRSVAGVYTKLRECGFRTKNGCIAFPLKLDTSKFPS